jgi:hypothetical protein
MKNHQRRTKAQRVARQIAAIPLIERKAMQFNASMRKIQREFVKFWMPVVDNLARNLQDIMAKHGRRLNDIE